MTPSTTLSCTCGAFQAEVAQPDARHGNHLICYCADCRAYLHHLGRAELLDADGGSRIFQVMPDQIRVTQGLETLAVLRLAPKGIYRWYTTCCKTPIANTVGSPKFPFAGLAAGNLAAQAPLGPIIAKVHEKDALTPVEGFGLSKMMRRTMRRMFWHRLTGRWRKTPFFDVGTKKAIVKPHVLTEAERSAAYAAGSGG